MTRDNKFIERDPISGKIVGVFTCPQLSASGKGFRTEADPYDDTLEKPLSLQRKADLEDFKARKQISSLKPIAPKLEETPSEQLP